MGDGVDIEMFLYAQSIASYITAKTASYVKAKDQGGGWGRSKGAGKGRVPKTWLRIRS